MRLSEIIPWGRSFDEYRLMFALSDDDLKGRILGCGDGPASFNAEGTANGHSIVSCDPIYAFSGVEIACRVEECRSTVLDQVRQHPDRFVWGYFRDWDDLGQRRMSAMRCFLDDFEVGKARGRYVTASLPSLPFEDRQFDLAVVSHLLFLYSQHLSYGLHHQSMLELVRVAHEVRVFPLLTLDRLLSPHLKPIEQALTLLGFSTTRVRTSYEFQNAEDHAGNQMLRITRRT